MGPEKIGTRGWMTIRSSGNRLYLPIDADLKRAFAFKKGDQLLVEIKEVRRAEEKGGDAV